MSFKNEEWRAHVYSLPLKVFRKPGLGWQHAAVIPVQPNSRKAPALEQKVRSHTLFAFHSLMNLNEFDCCTHLITVDQIVVKLYPEALFPPRLEASETLK